MHKPRITVTSAPDYVNSKLSMSQHAQDGQLHPGVHQTQHF